ncbi:MAG: histidine ammonia-lyase [Pyrinomonadaceae bacterium]
MPDKFMVSKEAVVLDGESLRLDEVVAVARDGRRALLSTRAKERMAESRRRVEEWASGTELFYGINTGFGANQNKAIAAGEIEHLQKNLILSHAAGVGEPFPVETVRAMMLLRANSLARGYSGIRIEVVEKLLELLNKGVTPVVPCKGSVGSSGDLAPLAHMTLVMLDLPGHDCGEAFFDEQRMTGALAMQRAGVEPVKLLAKEGLALTNGTQAITATGALALFDALNLCKVADICGSLTLEALKGKGSPFLEEPHELRPFQGQKDCARNVRALTEGSELKDCVDEDTAGQYQDAYSLRCMPQVHGASREAIAFVRRMIEIEINSVTDNPLIFPNHAKPLSAGNFHGQPVALSMDFLKLAVAELGNISERRVAYLTDEKRNRGLPAFLAQNAGVNSGLMMTQYTAAALASENKVLIHPASGDSIPTSANQEDHNSMGTIAARQAREVVDNVEQILAIEWLCSAQALEWRKQKPGVGTSAAYQLIRRHVPPLDEDRVLYPDIERARSLIHSGELVNAMEEANSITVL